MFAKRPTWTRTRVGRNRVHWVAYEDRPEPGERPGAGDPRIVDQGYAASLVEADSAARAALAAAGIYQARRLARGGGSTPTPRRDQAAVEQTRPSRQPRPEPVRPRTYLYTRHLDDGDGAPLVAAHLVIKRTARRVYVTRKSCGPDQLGTDDESWEPNEATISLDRAKLERDGSAFAGTYRQSEFYPTRAAALGDADDPTPAPLATLGLSAPSTIDEIKAAYRTRAFAVHPDRGGDPDTFRTVEAAYRPLAS